MLIEMYSPAFREKGKVRPPIRFKEGLNVVIGRNDGDNSIGKSSALLAIDFVFGGSTYLTSDGIKHIGDHTIYFAFEFNGEKYYYARHTGEPNNVYVCTSEYEYAGEIKTKAEFVDWLKEQYHINFQGLSFRDTVSRFFRIYSKGNLDEHRPLAEFPAESMQKSIDALVRLFDRYKDIELYKNRSDEQKDRLTAYKNARKYDFISNLVGGKKQYEENEGKIRELQMELDSLTAEYIENPSDKDIEKSQIKAELKDSSLRLETELQSKQRRLSLLDMSLEYGLYPTESDLTELQQFFPGVNIRKLYDVERYHKKLAVILEGQFEEEKRTMESEIAELQGRLMGLQEQIRQLGFTEYISKDFLDRHSEIKGQISALETQNKAYLDLNDLKDAKKKADEMLKKATDIILNEIEQTINDKMKELNDTLFKEPRKPPRLTISAYNKYQFETPDDAGTGSNYKGMILYDLAVLFSTDLPAVAHDSLIFSNIGYATIDGIMKIYSQSQKQIFIAFDKQQSFNKTTQKIVSENTVLKLSGNNCELYGKSWNKSTTENEDGI